MSPVVALLADLRALGVELVAAGDRLRFRPAAVVTDDIRAALRAHKPTLLALLASTAAPPDPLDHGTVVRLLAMPLDVFASAGQPLEVRVAWWPATLWFVPDVRHAEALYREGVARTRVWTAGELLSLLTAAPLTPGALATVMRARDAFDGEVVEVRPR